MTLRLTAASGLFLPLWLFAAAAIAGGPHQVRFDLAGGLVSSEAGPDTSWAAAVGVGLVMDDTYVLELRGLGQGSGGAAGSEGVAAGVLAVQYQLDVARFVPYLRLGVGFGAALGPEGTAVAPLLETGIGLRLTFESGWDLGIEGSGLQPFGAWAPVGSSGRFSVTLGYRLDLL